MKQRQQNAANAIARIVSAVTLCVLLAGCASNDSREETLIGNITKAYEAAQRSVASGNYSRAIQIFESLQARFPFSELSKQIQLELMHAYYKSNQPERAVDAADQFMRENPTHEHYDYALYLKGLAYFNDDAGFLERMFRRDVTNRPPRDAELSFSLMKRLVERYPASPYAADAVQRMIFLKNRMAAYEVSVARYYLNQDAYVAALNRAQHALQEFNGSTSGEDALDVIIQAYNGLGMDELASDAQRVRGANFPNES